MPAEGPLELLLELHYRRASWSAVSIRDDAVLDLAPHLVDLALLLTRAPTATVRSAKLTSERAELELDTDRGRARIRCATDRAHRELVVVRRPGGARIAATRAGGFLRGAMTRLPAVAHPLIASLRRPAQRLRRGRPRRGRRAAGDGRGRRAGDAGDRGRDVICVLQFDAAAVAVVERLLAEGRCRTSRRCATTGACTSSRRPPPTSPPAPSTPCTAGSSWATTGSSTRSSGPRPRSGPATPPPSTRRRRSGNGSPRPVCARSRSTPTRAGPRRARMGSSSADGGSATGSSCRAGRGPAGAAREHLRRHGRGPRRPRSSAVRVPASCCACAGS